MKLRTSSSCLHSVIVATAMGIGLYAAFSMPVHAAGMDDDQIRVRLAQFSSAGSRYPETLAFLGEVESPTAQLLRAKSMIGTGRTAEAVPLLQQLTRGDRHRGQAWLLLAQAGMVGRADVDIDDALRNAERLGHGETREQARFYLAESLRTHAQPDRAGQVLATMEPGYWAAIGYQNIAADYAQLDGSPSRSLVALRVALALLAEDDDAERARALKSELFLQAGYLAYRAEDFAKAESFLREVSLDSYNTPQALYFHGLALAGRQNFREAMQSWHRAKKYSLALPGVADAWLGMGQGYDELGYLGQAGEAFLAANAAFESERVTLKSLIEQVQQQGAWLAMAQAARATDLEWFLADSQSLAQPRRAYLLRFAETGGGQQVINRVATLFSLSNELDSRYEDLQIFRQAVQQRLNDLPSESYLDDQRVQADPRIAGLVDALKTIGPSASGDQRRQLEGLAQTLADLRFAYQHLPEQQPMARRRLRELDGKLASMSEAIEALKRQVAGIQRQAEQALDQQMVAFLESEGERIEFAQDRAEQHLAYLYEHLALRNLNQGDRE
ncbi:hypothetical protein [Marinobacter zhejiangensis]|uniref:Tetratricopeptide repeat-containing protein n=1 Tax=Marinobacter zhejiangensis TaxID=488535 RepID=A0A1I4RQN2_9GAMM|nr:hypothetical protein [Marinobacter zhejiangensis]SFM54518.1 hypothetical protein SAMN04487963_2894 [Marinobacter zhejiangensis]